MVISRTSFSVTSIDDEDDEFMDATEGVPNHRGTEEEEGRGDWRENGEGAPPGVCSVYEDTSDSWINVSYFNNNIILSLLLYVNVFIHMHVIVYTIIHAITGISKM